VVAAHPPLVAFDRLTTNRLFDGRLLVAYNPDFRKNEEFRKDPDALRLQSIDRRERAKSAQNAV